MNTDDGCRIEDVLQHGYRFALALTHDRAQAEDLVQEVAARMLRTAGEVNRFGFLRAVKNRFIDECRRNRVRSQVPMVDEPAGEVGDDAESDRDAPLALVNGALPRALSDLRSEERGVVFLWAVDDMTAQEIADLLEWPRSTVLSLLQRGRAKLRRLLEEEARAGGRS